MQVCCASGKCLLLFSFSFFWFAVFLLWKWQSSEGKSTFHFVHSRHCQAYLLKAAGNRDLAKPWPTVILAYTVLAIQTGHASRPLACFPLRIQHIRGSGRSRLQPACAASLKRAKAAGGAQQHPACAGMPGRIPPNPQTSSSDCNTTLAEGASALAAKLQWQQSYKQHIWLYFM